MTHPDKLSHRIYVFERRCATTGFLKRQAPIKLDIGFFDAVFDQCFESAFDQLIDDRR